MKNTGDITVEKTVKKWVKDRLIAEDNELKFVVPGPSYLPLIIKPYSRRP